MPHEILPILFVVAVCAGFIDAMAGGGGLITLPALLWTGLPPVAALATNKLQGFFGVVASTTTFARAGYLDFRTMLPAVICTGIGAALGAFAVQAVETRVLHAVVPFLLVGASIYFLVSPRASDATTRQRIPPALFAATIAPALGFYDGFFGPGTGSFYALALVGLLGFGLRGATAHAKLLNVTSNGMALGAFLVGGKVVWTAGLVMAAGQVVGGSLGSRVAIRWGARVIRPLLVIMALAVSVKLLSEPGNPIHELLRRR